MVIGVTENNSEMVERAAKAMQSLDSTCTCIECMRDKARAAIKAIREPTEQMLDAGGWAIAQRNGDMSPETEALAQLAWPAMIDEALK